MTAALFLAFAIAHGPVPAAAQAPRSAMGACQRARTDLRAELARNASLMPRVGWSAETSRSTSNGASITATQRTLYARSSAMLDSAGAFLDSLRPLHADVDEPTIEQTRPQLRARLAELAGEFSRPDGPRSEVTEPALKDAAALVMRLGVVLCRAGAVNQEEEARTAARYVRLEHAMATIRRDWIAAGPPRRPIVFATGPAIDPSLSARAATAPTNVSGVTDSLDAVTQSLDSLESALELMQLAPEERDSVTVLGADAKPLALSEVLTRIERFAAEDAPRVLEGGGGDALPTLAATADTLRQLVRGLRLPVPVAHEGEAQGVTRDAQAALERLAQRLDALYRLLAPSPTPPQ